jgi:hypothetical protein
MSHTASKNVRVLAAAMAVCAGLAASGASAAIVSRTFTISTADIVDLYSATFDAGLTPCVAPATQECAFFGGTLPAGRAIAITQTGTGSGTLNVDYDTVTGEITQVNSMVINLTALGLVITRPLNTTTVVVTPGNGIPAANDTPFVESGTGPLNRDLDGASFGTVLGTGSVDADQAPAVGQSTVFQHVEPTLPIPVPDAPDFAPFQEIVDSCTDTSTDPQQQACPLITLGLLTLDGVRYRMEGRVGCDAAGRSLILKTQTANGSIYRVNLTITTPGGGDCDVDGVQNSADNCPDESNAGQADQDSDGRGNVCDNCRNVANNTGVAAQCNSDADAFGNRCDGDLNGNNSTNAQDTTLFRQALGQASTAPFYNRADINCNGSVNAQDTTLYRTLLGAPPGPGPAP